MQNGSNSTIVSPIQDNPEAHARDVVEAMRLVGNNSPLIERAILAAGVGHARAQRKIEAALKEQK